MKQTNFFKSTNSYKSFGGELLKCKRKSRRPLDIKKSIHLVLRADITRSGTLRKKLKHIDTTLLKYADKFGVRIYQRAIASNHIHAVIKVNHRHNYQYFVRAVTGVLAKTIHLKWILRPFTRIISWGSDLKNTIKYVIQNELEAAGLIAYKPRRRIIALRKPP
jgi:putative transposase